MREIICLNIGQAGCQIAHSNYELLTLEHSINPDGFKNEPFLDLKNEDSPFFYKTDMERYVPRSIFVDLEPTVIDEIRNSPYGQLHHPNNLISYKEDAANNFARGKYRVGREILEETYDRINKLAENCENLQGFLIFNSVGGGTGSGFTSILMEKLGVDFSKKTKIGFEIYPSPKLSTCVVEPYNAILATSSLMEFLDVAIVMDNEAIYDICGKKLDIDRPSYLNLNRLIAQLTSGLTTSLRFEGALNTDLNQIQTNLIPYQRIHFCNSSLAPLVSIENSYFNDFNINDITNSLFESDSMFAKINLNSGKYMACCALYRGDVVPRDVCNAMANIKGKKTIKFVDWCPTSVKVGINCQQSFVVPNADLPKTMRNACMISNHSGIKEVFKKLAFKFDLMYGKRAFVHWFVGAGLEEDEMTTSREELASLQKDYEEIEADLCE